MAKKDIYDLWLARLNAIGLELLFDQSWLPSGQTLVVCQATPTFLAAP